MGSSPAERATSSSRIESASGGEPEVVGSSPAERATSSSRTWYIYVLENDSGLRYTGSTGRRPEIRVAEHNAGLNRWTRARRPWHLAYCEQLANKRAALARERFLKTGAGRREVDAILEARG